SWSINPESVTAEEYGTAPLAARLSAASRVVRAGYRVGFHLDPIIEHDGWERGDAQLLERVFASVSPGDVAWFSLGPLRMTPSLRRAVRRRDPHAAGRRSLGAELVAGADGKLRVWQGLRVRMYRFLVERIRAWAPDVTVYLCMEPGSIWQRVMRE